jgi:hypothetical protein
MRTLAATLVVVALLATAAHAQELTAAVASYRSFGIDDLDGTLPLSVEIRVSVPLSDRFALEPFFTAGSNRRPLEVEGFYGAHLRQRLARRTSDNAYAFVTYGAAGYYWKNGAGLPVIGHLGFGVHKRLTPRLAFRPEVQLMTCTVVPVGARFVAGLSWNLSR